MGFGKAKCSFLILFSCCSSILLGADSFAELLHEVFRPTMTEVSRLLKEGKTTESFPGDSELDDEIIREEIPRGIATLEYFFPGATFAALGRDAFLLGDVLDAFYLSIGQQGRVVRLNCSAGTFRNQRISQILPEFLRQAGAHFRGLRRAQPFVIFDSTDMGDNSQSTKLIKTAFDHFGENIGPREIVHKFHLVSTRHGKKASETNPAAYFKESASDVHWFQRLRRPLQIEFLHPFMYPTTWHGKFGEFTEVDGRWTGTPGPRSALGKRYRILKTQELIWKTVSDPGFYRLVEREAHRLRYQFTRQRISGAGSITVNEIFQKRIADRARVEKLRAASYADAAAELLRDLKNLVSTFKVTDGSVNQRTENGRVFYDWLKAVPLTDFKGVQKFYSSILETALQQYDKGNVSEYLIQEVCKALLTAAGPSDRDFSNGFIRFYRKYDGLRKNPYLHPFARGDEKLGIVINRARRNCGLELIEPESAG